MNGNEVSKHTILTIWLKYMGNILAQQKITF